MAFDLTRIVYIGDRSGSMGSLIGDCVEGFNAYIKSQKDVPGAATVSLHLFNHNTQTVFKDVPIEEVRELNVHDWYASGYTAMYDAIGYVLSDLIATQTPNVKTIVTIQTDGQENSSTEFNQKIIKELITRAEDQYGIDVLFVGANIDVASVSVGMGIKGGKFAAYDQTAKGFSDQYATLSAATTLTRSIGACELNLQDTYNQIAKG